METKTQSSEQTNQTGKSKVWVVKIGSSVLGGSESINSALMHKLSEQIFIQQKKGNKFVLVTSGAISQGMRSLNIKKRPNSIDKLQALASIGQIKIVSAFAQALESQSLSCAQILLTAEDLRNRKRYLNAKNTINSLLAQGVVPIVNENDTISTQSIRFGDNDTLAALVSNLIFANYLLFLTNQKGLYDKDPNKFHEAKLIEHISSADPKLDSIEGLESKSALGSGGMKSKINAVKTAALSGTHTIIANGFDFAVTDNIFNHPHSKGSFFESAYSAQRAKKLWLAHALEAKGEIEVNLRASKALLDSASLLAVGIVGAQGSFRKGDLVVISTQKTSKDPSVEIARGISNYSAKEIEQIKGLNTKDILSKFGFDEQVVVHRDNMMIAGF